MNALLLTALLTATPLAQQPGTSGSSSDRQGSLQSSTGQATAGSSHMDGTWQLVYGEAHGRRMDASGGNVTIRGNTLSFSHDGKQKSYRLRFGPNQMVWASDMGSGSGQAGSGDSSRGGIIPAEGRADPTNRGQSGTSGTGGQSGTSSGTGGQSGTTGTSATGRGSSGTGANDAGAAGSSAALGMRRGVYINSQEYLCIALEDMNASGSGGAGSSSGANRSGTGGTGTSGTGSGTGNIGTGTSGTGTGIGGSRTGTSGQGATGRTGLGQDDDRLGANTLGGPNDRPGLVLILRRSQGQGNR